MLNKIKVKLLLWILEGATKDGWRRRFVIHKILTLVEGLKMKASWKTTLCGLVGAVGAYLVTVKDPAWLSLVGQFLTALGTAGVGLFARDNSVSSEDVGIK